MTGMAPIAKRYTLCLDIYRHREPHPALTITDVELWYSDWSSPGLGLPGFADAPSRIICKDAAPLVNPDQHIGPNTTTTRYRVPITSIFPNTGTITGTFTAPYSALQIKATVTDHDGEPEVLTWEKFDLDADLADGLVDADGCISINDLALSSGSAIPSPAIAALIQTRVAADIATAVPPAVTAEVATQINALPNRTLYLAGDQLPADAVGTATVNGTALAAGGTVPADDAVIFDPITRTIYAAITQAERDDIPSVAAGTSALQAGLDTWTPAAAGLNAADYRGHLLFVRGLGAQTPDRWWTGIQTTNGVPAWATVELGRITP